jgi:hypothetical protein
MMEVGITGALQALLPRLILYTFFGIFVAWVFHLIQPALVAALSPDYRDFNWVTGKKSVGSFLKSTWNIAVNSKETFGDIHRRVLDLYNFHLALCFCS